MNKPSIMRALPAFSISRSLKPALAAAALLAVPFLSGSAQAATDTWLGTTSANFADGSNWSLGAAPNGNQAVFNAAGTSGTTLSDNVGAGEFFYGIDFTSTAPAYTINGTTGSIIIAANSGGTGPIQSESSANETFNVGIQPFAPTGAVALNTNSTGNLIFNGVIANTGGNSSISVNGTGGGAVVLGAANTFTGGASVSAGSTLQLANANALQNSALTLNGSGSGGTTNLQLRGSSGTTFNFGTQTTNGVSNNILLNNGVPANNTYNFDVAGAPSGTLTVGTVAYNSYFLQGGSNSLDGNGNYGAILTATDTSSDNSALTIQNIVSTNSFNILSFGPVTVVAANYFEINSTIQNFNVGTFTGSSHDNSFLYLGGAGNTTFTGVIAPGSGPTLSVIDNQTGTVTLAGNNTYNSLAVNSGTVLAKNTSGSATGVGSLTVAAGATIGGTGTSSGTSFTIGAPTGSAAQVLAGLNSASDPSVSTSLTLIGSGASTIQNANLTFNISTTSLGSGSQLSVGATPITFGTAATTLSLNLVGANIIPAFTDYVLIAGTTTGGTDQYSGLSLGTPTGTLATGLFTPILNSGVGGSGNLTLAFATPGGASYYGPSNLFLYQNSTTGADDIEVQVVPEPSTWAMMLGGLGVLILWQRRRQNRTQS